MPEGLDLSEQDGVISAVIWRGPDNLLTSEICGALTAVLRSPPQGAHVLRVAARGEVFCLGRERAADDPESLRAEVGALIELNQALTSSPLVTVAQVHGNAAGFGVGLAALCDVSIAAPSAEFWFPEVTIDLAPAVVLAWLPRLVGRKQAFHLTATGAHIDAREARTLGLLTAVAAGDAELEPTVDRYITELRRFSPRIHAQIASFLNSTEELPQAHAYELATEKLILGSMARRRT